MTELAVLVPVLGRPHRVEPLLKSIKAATPEPHAVYFIHDRADVSEVEAIQASNADGEAICCEGGYAAKIHAGVELTDEPLIFLAADDLNFRPGWFEAASACLEDGVEVVGVNDLLVRSREHATHFLMTRAYAERTTIDGDPGPLHQGYSHWFCDNELIETARARGAYAYCAEAVVEHLHPTADKAPDDATYARGRENRYSDGVLFRRRTALWR